MLVVIGFNTNVLANDDLFLEIDEYLTRYSNLNTFNGTVLVARDGDVIINKGYGKADFELDVDNKSDSRYRIGSLTKQFTAAAILQLKENGLLRLDDKVNNYVSNFGYGDQITIRNLLNHTSGFYDYTTSKEFRENMGKRVKLEEVVDIFRDKELNFEPGKEFQYSNSNYLLLGYIIENVTEKSYENYLKEEILNPIDMKNTGYAYHDKIIKKRSEGYMLNPDGSKNNIYHDDATYAHAAGALYSTTLDLLKWDQALYTNKILTNSSLKEMFTTYKSNYGFGFKIDKLFNKKRYYHHGGNMGYTSSINRFVDDKITIIVLTNLNGTPIEKIVKDISAIIFNEDYFFPNKYSIKKDEFKKIEGRYKMNSNREVVIKTINDKYLIKLGRGPFFEMIPSGRNEFVVKVFAEKVKFKEKNDEIIIYHLSGTDKGKKI